MLEIVENISAKCLLEKTRLFAKDNVINFSVMSSYGKLSDIKNGKTRKIANQALNITEEFNFLKQELINHQNIRIWYCSKDSESVCNMYLLVDYLQNKNVKINICNTYKPNYRSLTSYKENEIKNLLNNTKELTTNEIKKISYKWETLVKENCDLRIIENGNLKSYDFKYLDNKILDLLKKNESIYIFKFIGLCIKNEICGYHMDFVYEERINYLIKTKKIKIDKIEKAKNFMGEDINKKYISIIS